MPFIVRAPHLFGLLDSELSKPIRKRPMGYIRRRPSGACGRWPSAPSSASSGAPACDIVTQGRGQTIRTTYRDPPLRYPKSSGSDTESSSKRSWVLGPRDRTPVEMGPVTGFEKGPQPLRKVLGVVVHDPNPGFSPSPPQESLMPKGVEQHLLPCGRGSSHVDSVGNLVEAHLFRPELPQLSQADPLLVSELFFHKGSGENEECPLIDITRVQCGLAPVVKQTEDIDIGPTPFLLR